MAIDDVTMKILQDVTKAHIRGVFRKDVEGEMILGKDELYPEFVHRIIQKATKLVHQRPFDILNTTQERTNELTEKYHEICGGLIKARAKDYAHGSHHRAMMWQKCVEMLEDRGFEHVDNLGLYTVMTHPETGLTFADSMTEHIATNRKDEYGAPITVLKCSLYQQLDEWVESLVNRTHHELEIE